MFDTRCFLRKSKEYNYTNKQTVSECYKLQTVELFSVGGDLPSNNEF